MFEWTSNVTLNNLPTIIAPNFEIGFAKSQTIGGIAFFFALVEKRLTFIFLFLKRFKIFDWKKSLLLLEFLNKEIDLDDFCWLNKRTNSAFVDLSFCLNKFIRFEKRFAIIHRPNEKKNWIYSVDFEFSIIVFSLIYNNLKYFLWLFIRRIE